MKRDNLIASCPYFLCLCSALLIVMRVICRVGCLCRYSAGKYFLESHNIYMNYFVINKTPLCLNFSGHYCCYSTAIISFSPIKSLQLYTSVMYYIYEIILSFQENYDSFIFSLILIYCVNLRLV